jgi:hypothetical protein
LIPKLFAFALLPGYAGGICSGHPVVFAPGMM